MCARFIVRLGFNFARLCHAKLVEKNVLWCDGVNVLLREQDNSRKIVTFKEAKPCAVFVLKNDRQFRIQEKSKKHEP